MSDEMPVDDVEPLPPFEPEPYQTPPLPELPEPGPSPRPRLPEPGFDQMPTEPINTFVCTNSECPQYEFVGLNYSASITQPLCGGCGEPTEERPV